MKKPQGGTGREGRARALSPADMSADDLRAAGYTEVFRGVGPRGLESIRPSATGALGPGVYFYDSASQARAYSEPGGGIITGFVRLDAPGVETQHVAGGRIGTPHNVVKVPSAGDFIRRGTIPTSETSIGWSEEDRKRWEGRVERALNEGG